MAVTDLALRLGTFPEDLQALALEAVRALVLGTGLDAIHLLTIRHCIERYPVEFKRAYEAYRDQRDATEFLRRFPGAISMPTSNGDRRTFH